MESVEALLGAAVKLEVEAILNLIQADPHQWSDRPCPTCRAISTLAGRPFGCSALARMRRVADQGGAQ